MLDLDIRALFAVALVVISIIGWLMNIINAQNPPAPPNRPARRPQHRDRKIETEIEAFLQEAMGRRAPQRPKEEVDGIEIIEPQPARRSPPSRRPPLKSDVQTIAGAEPKASQPLQQLRPGEGVASRQMTSSSTLGTGVRSHLQEHMQPRVGQQVEENLPHAVTESISEHLGQFSADDRDMRSGVAPIRRSRAAVDKPSALIGEIRKPSGMRRAVILHEILSRPRVLRKR